LNTRALLLGFQKINITIILNFSFYETRRCGSPNLNVGTIALTDVNLRIIATHGMTMLHFVVIAASGARALPLVNIF
jgi:hypothetical protein